MHFSSQLRNPRLALYPLPSRIFEGAQSLTNQAYTCFVYLQKASDPWNIPWGCFGSMGVCGLLLQAIRSLRLGLRQGSLFISDSIHIFMDRICRCSHEIDRWIGGKSVCITKLSIYWSFYVPALNYAHELWIVTKRMSQQAMRYKQ